MGLCYASDLQPQQAASESRAGTGRITYEIDLGSCPQEALRGWLELARELQLSPTLYPDWAATASTVFGQQAGTRLLVVEESGAVAGAIPYRISRSKILGVPFTTIQPVSNLMSYHAELVATRPREALLELLDGVAGWDIFHMANVPAGSETERALHDVASRRHYGITKLAVDESPYLPIDRTWTEFLAGRNKKFRYKYRKRQELLSSGQFTMEFIRSTEQVERFIDAILKIERQSWKATYAHDLISKPEELRYYRTLLPVLAQRGELIAFLLFDGRNPIAFSLCCHSDGWMGQMKTSFDERYATHSPGAIIVDASVRYAFESGAREFDFLGHTDKHKFNWTDQTREHSDHFLFSGRIRARALNLARSIKRRALGYRRIDPVKPEA